ncbi:MAG TPA: hypothetical protein VGB77_10815 [Abditibacteriaceae bacterium]|jgi:hypothetical protein
MNIGSEEILSGCLIFFFGGLLLMLAIWGLAALGVPGPIIALLRFVLALALVKLILDYVFD